MSIFEMKEKSKLYEKFPLAVNLELRNFDQDTIYIALYIVK